MAALVTVTTLPRLVSGARGPIKVADANETDLSTPDTSIVIDTVGVSLMVMQVIKANYTSVTVKAQRSLNGFTTPVDITDASLSDSGIVSFDPKAPQVRLSIAGTLSGGADTLQVFVYLEESR